MRRFCPAISIRAHGEGFWLGRPIGSLLTGLVYGVFCFSQCSLFRVWRGGFRGHAWRVRQPYRPQRIRAVRNIRSQFPECGRGLPCWQILGCGRRRCQFWLPIPGAAWGSWWRPEFVGIVNAGVAKRLAANGADSLNILDWIICHVRTFEREKMSQTRRPIPEDYFFLIIGMR